jgi:hypothetical protein
MFFNYVQIACDTPKRGRPAASKLRLALSDSAKAMSHEDFLSNYLQMKSTQTTVWEKRVKSQRFCCTLLQAVKTVKMTTFHSKQLCVMKPQNQESNS